MNHKPHPPTYLGLLYRARLIILLTRFFKVPYVRMLNLNVGEHTLKAHPPTALGKLLGLTAHRLISESFTLSG